MEKQSISSYSVLDVLVLTEEELSISTQ